MGDPSTAKSSQMAPEGVVSNGIYVWKEAMAAGMMNSSLCSKEGGPNSKTRRVGGRSVKAEGCSLGIVVLDLTFYNQLGDRSEEKKRRDHNLEDTSLEKREGVSSKRRINSALLDC